jgi:hypothetical protein
MTMRARAALTMGCLAASLLAAGLPAGAASAAPAAAGITKVEAQKLARAGVLTKSDLPKYDVERSTRDASDEEFDARFYQCLGVKAPKYLVRNPGKVYTLGNLSIDSYADVVASVRQARDDVKAVGSKKGAACYEQFMTEGAAEQGVEITSLSVKRIPFTVANADQAIAFRMTGVFSVEGNPLLLDGLVVVARVGQTQVVVAPGRYGGGTPSRKQARALTNKVAQRVAAAT